MIITGNIMVDDKNISLPLDLKISENENELNDWKSLRGTVGNDKLFICQINDPGPQACRYTFAKSPIGYSRAPSEIRRRFPNNILFNDANQLTVNEIDIVVGKFVRSAKYLQQIGFDGVQVHASHGYLLSSFMTPLTNSRGDEYGLKRSKITIDIINSIKLECGSDFCVGVKLNSSDFVKGGLDTTQAFENFKQISEQTDVDFIEISGGNYDSLEFLSRSSGVFFEEFAKYIRDYFSDGLNDEDKPCIMLTGGFRNRKVIDRVLNDKICDLVGIGRPACIDDNVAWKLSSDSNCIINTTDYEVDSIFGVKTLGFIGGSIRTLGYVLHLHRFARNNTHIPFKGFGIELFTELLRGLIELLKLYSFSIVIIIFVIIVTTFLSIH